MPVTVQLATSDAFALGVLSGDVTWPEIAAAMRALYGRSDADPNLDVVWDGRTISTMDIAPEYLPEIVSLRQELRKGLDGGRTAAVFTRDSDQLVGRLFGSQVRRTRREHRVFDCMSKALAFLDREVLPTHFDRQLLAP